MNSDIFLSEDKHLLRSIGRWSFLRRVCFFLLGAILNWNWLCNPKGTRSVYSIFGRTGHRIAFGVGGAVLLIVGVWMLFV